VTRSSRRLGGAAAILVLVLMLVVSLGAGSASGTGREASTDKVILFASDGMRPDLMEDYARHGSMPTYRALMHDGVRGQNGLMQGFPPNTGVGWATLATGAWPGTHGSTNNTFHRLTDPSFNSSTSFSQTGLLQAETLGQAAERAGKTVASVDGLPHAATCRRSRGRSWTSGRSSRAAGSCSTTTFRGSPPARTRSASTT
jgi:predicted AlkP superfamily pyrophosphatase or phosphodiesterase